MHIVEIGGPVGDAVHRDLADWVTPDQVGEDPVIAACLDCLHEQMQRFFGRVATDDEVHAGVVPHDFLVVVGGAEAAEDDRDVGMQLLEQFR